MRHASRSGEGPRVGWLRDRPSAAGPEQAVRLSQSQCGYSATLTRTRFVWQWVGIEARARFAWAIARCTREFLAGGIPSQVPKCEGQMLGAPKCWGTYSKLKAGER
jgi:hypothetical protein